jgi:DNA polymerase III subunit epsilon
MSCIAIIDVETTGLNPYNCDRIVEIAALVVQPDGEIVQEFVSLVNPERDMGPTSIHGLTSADVLPAPRFGQLVGSLCSLLGDCVAVAGHNIRFDLSFLACEFKRLGYIFPSCPKLCTLHLAGGGTLSLCCKEHNIMMDGALHSALDDARATARLLGKLLADDSQTCDRLYQLSPIVWPKIPILNVNSLTRSESCRRQSEPPTYIQKLRARATSSAHLQTSDEAALAYLGVLDHILEHRSISEEESQNLVDLAEQWGLSGVSIAQMHIGYLEKLTEAAFGDGILTEAEQRDLILVSHLLGIDQISFERVVEKVRCITSARSKQPHQVEICQSKEEFRGKRVCFTGECQFRYNGVGITREMAIKLASDQGLIVVDSVTKKLDLLVIADPLTQSSKAKQARRYGIRLISESVFWKDIGVEVE